MTTNVRKADILIVSAHPPELSGLAPVLGTTMESEISGRVVRAEAIGIGLVEAALGAISALERSRPDLVVLIGTCGAYRDRGLSLGDVIVGRRVHLVSAARAIGQGDFPGPMPASCAPASDVARDLLRGGFAAADIATTTAITTDDALAASIAGSVGADVEHLEAFAVARACVRAGVACGIVLGVANFVGNDAREQWRKNHVTTGDAAARAVAAWLAGQ